MKVHCNSGLESLEVIFIGIPIWRYLLGKIEPMSFKEVVCGKRDQTSLSGEIGSLHGLSGSALISHIRSNKN